jgi:proline iminopeptidase
MELRVLLIGAGSAALLAAAGGAAMYHWMGKGLYEPGRMAADEKRSLDLPGAPSADLRFWAVEDGIKLFHFEDGTGDDVVVVHGGPGFPVAEPWEGTKALNDRFRFHFYHQRGCGQSTRPVDRADGTRSFYQNMVAVERQLGLGAQVADLERIRRILGREKLTLIGHSFGGLIAALYAAEFPDRVKALVLVVPADLVKMPKRGDDLFAVVGERLPAGMRPEYDRYLQDYFDFRALFAKDDRQLSEFFGSFARYYAAAHGGAEAGQVRREGETRGGGWMPLAVYLSMGKRHDWSAALARVRTPVLVVHGSKDMLPVSDSREFASYFTHAELAVVPDAGHFPFEDQPREFARVVGAFLAKTSDGAAKP